MDSNGFEMIGASIIIPKRLLYTTRVKEPPNFVDEFPPKITVTSVKKRHPGEARLTGALFQPSSGDELKNFMC